MWAWLIMDYTTSEENGHWKCKLTSDMFLCGERKNRNLTLFCIPNFVMKCLTCLFGSKEYPDDGSGESSNSSCCKKCTYISSVFLVPLALVLGVLGKINIFFIRFFYHYNSGGNFKLLIEELRILIAKCLPHILI